MPLIPWRPFMDLNKFFNDEDNFFSLAPILKAEPAMDIYETDKDVVVEMNLPGVDPDKIDILASNQVLRVSGKIEEEKEEKKKGYWRKEIKKGSFERAAQLPAAVKEDKIDATYEKGVLKITMPKIEIKEMKKAKVKVKEK